MPFDPLYSTTPGRPVNLRRDIGVALGQTPLPQEDPDTGFSLPGTGSIRDRVTGAASAIGSSIPTDTPSAFGQFAGGLARGFAGVQAYLQAVTGQATERREANTDRELNRERIRATTTAEQARAESERAQAERARQAPSAPTPAADNWELVPGAPGTPQMQRNRRDGSVKPVLDPTGRPVRVPQRPIPAPRAGRSAAPTASTPLTPAQAQQMLDDIAAKHPEWTDEQVAAEARKQAGIR